MTRLDKVANIALILACTLFIGHLARNYYFSRVLSPNLSPEIKVGEVVKLPGPDTADRRPASATLVLALSSSCGFCQTSMPFYQKLAALRSSSSERVRLATVMPQSREEAESYLKNNGVVVDAVFSMPMSQIGINGTPTLLLLDGQNRLARSWAGRLNSSQESEVIAHLRELCPECPK